MKQSQKDILISALTLAASFLSLLFLSLAWYHTAVEGRSFPSVGRSISAAPFVDSVPFAWPYLIAGFLFRQRHVARRALWWAVGTGLAGAALHALLVRAQFPPAAPLDSYVYFYSRFLSAPLLTLLGFVIGHIARTRNERTA